MYIDHLKKNMPTKAKLLVTLYYLGLSDRYRLAKLLDVKVSTVDTVIQRLNRNPEGKMVFSRTPLFQSGPKLYQLTSVGWKWVSLYLGEDRKYDERSEAQDKHYNGMTDILIRLIERMGRQQVYERVEYLNSYETEKLILSPFEIAHWEALKDKKFRYEFEKNIPFPDLFISVNGVANWIEFDTGNPSPGKLLEKKKRYYRMFPSGPIANMGLNHRIVWVTVSQKQKETMERCLRNVEMFPEFRDTPKVEMHFFVEGEETDFLMNYQSLVNERMSV